MTGGVVGVGLRFAATGTRTVVRAIRVIAVRVSRTTRNDAVVGDGRAIVSTRYADAIAASVESFGPVPTIESSPTPTPTPRVRQNRRILCHRPKRERHEEPTFRDV